MLQKLFPGLSVRFRPHTARGMQLEFALLAPSRAVWRGSILLGDDERTDSFQGTEGRLAVTHRFQQPASSLLMVLQSPSSAEVFSSAVAIGVHHSSSWEQLGIGFHTLHYRCTPKP